MRKFLVITFILCVLTLITLLILRVPVGLWVLAVVAWIQKLGLKGLGVFAMLYVASTVMLFPQTPLNLGAGFLYGPLWGSLVVSIASTAAATIAFLLTRYCARDFVSRHLGKHTRLETLDQAVQRNGLKLVALMRLQPVFVPFAYLNMGLGLTQVSLSDYVLGTFIGTLPGTILYAYAGSAVKDISFFAFRALPSEHFGPAWFFWMGLAAAIAFSILLAHIAKQSFSTTLREQRAEGLVPPPEPGGILALELDDSSANI